MINEDLVFITKDWPFLVNFNFTRVAILHREKQEKMANFKFDIQKYIVEFKGLSDFTTKYADQMKTLVVNYADQTRNELVNYADQTKKKVLNNLEVIKNDLSSSISKSDAVTFFRKYDDQAKLFVKTFYKDEHNYLVRCLEATLIILILCILLKIVQIAKRKILKKDYSKKEENKTTTKFPDDNKGITQPKWKKPDPIQPNKVDIAKPKPAWQRPSPVTSRPSPVTSRPIPVTSRPSPVTSRPSQVTSTKKEPITQQTIKSRTDIAKPKPAWQRPSLANSTKIEPAPIQTNGSSLGQKLEKNPTISESNNEKGWFGEKKPESTKDITKSVEPNKSWFGNKKDDNNSAKSNGDKEQDKASNNSWFSKGEPTKTELQSSDAKSVEPNKSWFGNKKDDNDSAKLNGNKEQEQDKASNNSWFSKGEPKKTELQSSDAKEDTKSGKSWFGFGSEKDICKQKETLEATKEQSHEEKSCDTIKMGRSIDLNIDPNPRSRREMNRSKTKTIDIVKRMGSKVRELNEIAGAGDEEIQEKKQDMEKIKTARSFFKEGAKRAQSMGGVPRVKFISDEDFGDAYKRDSSLIRKRGFEVGKLSSRDCKMFEEGDSRNTSVNVRKTPRRKLMTLDQVMKVDNSNLDCIKINRDIELDELRDARPTPILQRWQPKDEQEKPQEIQMELENISQAQNGVKKRWQPTSQDRATKTRSMDVPQKKLRINDFVDPEVSRADPAEEARKERSMEIEQIRESRPTPVTKRWGKNQQAENGDEGRRSKSVSSVPRAKLTADNDWMRSNISSREVELRMETTLEMQEIKRVRALGMEGLEDEDNINRDKLTKLKMDTTKELQEIKHVRTRAMEEQEEAAENARKESINRRAKELALMALELQNSKERESDEI